MPTSTLDYLPDLTSSEKSSATTLFLTPYTPTLALSWDNSTNYYTSKDYAILYDDFKWNAVKGATYDIFSDSYFDPFIVIVYDQYGNAIETGDDDDYGTDIVWDFVAPYSGDFYVSASWNQGSYYKFVSLSIYEDLDTETTNATSKDDVLTGTSGKDSIHGLSGNDELNGGLGKDTMTGGKGKDIFVFDTTLGTSNIDTITDFKVADDTIQLENGIFKAFGTTTGTIATANFVKNTDGKAKDNNDFIIYETDTGKIFYDADGSGSGTAVQVALIANKASLTYADFVLI